MAREHRLRQQLFELTHLEANRVCADCSAPLRFGDGSSGSGALGGGGGGGGGGGLFGGFGARLGVGGGGGGGHGGGGHGGGDGAWASPTHGVFLCAVCAGAHRSLGPRHSTVKSLTLDRWGAAEVAALRASGGNAAANAVHERYLPPGLVKPGPGAEPGAKRQWVKAKYVQRLSWLGLAVIGTSTFNFKNTTATEKK